MEKRKHTAEKSKNKVEKSQDQKQTEARGAFHFPLLVENENLRLNPERQGGLTRKWAHLAQGRTGQGPGN